MDIEVKEYRRLIIVEVSGRIEGSTWRDFESRLSNELEKGNNNIVIDMRDVEFLGSRGLSVLTKINTAASSAGGELIICTPSERAIESLKLGGLYNRPIRVINEREEAIASF